MSSQDDQLIRCFHATFGELPVETVVGASVDTLEGWDSLQTVILVAVLEETFELRIPAQELPELRSYASVRDYLRRRQVLR
jgi:acyl carrier protein